MTTEGNVYTTSGFMVTLDLRGDGRLVLRPRNSAAAAALTGNSKSREIVLDPEQCGGVLVERPCPRLYLHGLLYLQSNDGAREFVVPFRNAQALGVQELLLRMEQVGWPAALAGKRAEEEQ